MAAPRLFGIRATDADVVAVLRRGPSDWVHVGAWYTGQRRYEPGAWLRGRLYPQRCDVSADGRYLCALVLRGGAHWAAGSTYVSVSRLPWLTALAAWGTSGTWTRGLHLVDDPAVWEVGEPDVGDPAPLRRRYGLAVTRPESFAVERRRGWVETPDSQPRDPGDVWDERRADGVRLGRPRPGGAGGVWLVASGGFAAHRSMDDRWYRPPEYRLRDGPDGADRGALDGVQWADWNDAGELLLATASGRLQVCDGDPLAVRWEHDLAGLEPDPRPGPASAAQW